MAFLTEDEIFQRMKANNPNPDFNITPKKNSGFSTTMDPDNSKGSTATPHLQLHGGNDIFEADEHYWKQLNTLYANVLDASGINLKDPMDANLYFYNKHLKRGTVDIPYIGRSYVFVTRPDLNIYGAKIRNGVTTPALQRLASSGYSNLMKLELFNYMSRTEIGKHILPFLTYPHEMKLYPLNKGHRINRSPIGENSDIGSVAKTDTGMKNCTPFIPFLTNFCIDSGGAKDLTMEEYETEGDFSGNKLVYPKGADETYTVGETSLTFKDMYGSPILHLFNMWVQYMYYLSKGIIISNFGYRSRHEVDFTCSIYIFVLDRDGQTILRWCKYTGCFPNNIPYNTIKHSLETPVDALADITINFKYNRFEPMKPSTFLDFNKICYQFVDKALTLRSKPGKPGLRPEPLIKPFDGNNYLLEKVINPNYFPPQTIDPLDPNGTTKKNKDKFDYDSLYWGSIPYIAGNKLIFI
jgi:hypothetical protein